MMLYLIKSNRQKRSVVGKMPDEPIFIIITLLVFILLGAFFGSSETAFTTADRFRLRVKAENGSFSAKLALFVTKHIDNTIVTMLICNSLLQTTAAFLATIFFVRLFPENMEGVATLLSSISVAFVIFILCDSIPKTIAHAAPEAIAMINSYLASVLIIILFPISFVFNSINRLFKRVFKYKEDSELSEEDFSNMIEAIEEKGGMDENTSDIIISSLEFVDTNLRDIITPKEQIVGYDITDFKVKDFNEFIINTTYSRIPLYKDSINNIVGTIVVREYIKKFVKNKQINITRIMNKPYFVNYKSNIVDILDHFKKNNTHIAFIVDDKNNLLGMASMEDVLEELVGQIAEPPVQKEIKVNE